MKNSFKLVLTILILGTGIVIVYGHVFSSSEQHIAIKAFPSGIAEWTATEVPYDEETIRTLDPDQTIYRSYHSGSTNSSITVFIGYYGTLEKADLSHSPIVCFSGQGWEIENQSVKEIPIQPPSGLLIEANQMIQSKLNTRMLTLYWYQTFNRAFSNRGMEKLHLFANKFLGKPDANAFVRLTMVIPQGKSLEETEEHLVRFVEVFYPALIKFFRE